MSSAAAALLGGLAALGACSAATAPELPPARDTRPPVVAEREVPGGPARVTSYTLRARLDTSTHSVDGEGTIDWINLSRAPTQELYLHLYLNAFKDEGTLFNRSAFARARSGRRPTRFGSITLTRLFVRELGRDLVAELEPHSPGDPADETDRRLALPRAIQPGEKLTLDIAWRSVLPELVERTGVSRDFYFVAQWFPKLARLEPDGTWAHFAFHPHAEFYADFGDYDVQLDVPSPLVVGATGRRIDEHVEGSRRILRHRAAAVHDFAWTAWDGFVRRRERIAETDVELLLPEGHGQNAEILLRTLRFALPHFEARYGDYPYGVLTVVHPPRHAWAAGGMEYPTLITTLWPWHVGYWSHALESVTIHELGHQWFYGLLASNEERWPFLDEGLNSYAESVAMQEMYGAGSAARAGGFELSHDAFNRALWRRAPLVSPVSLPARAFSDFDQISSVVYAKSALLFRTLGNVYGQAELERALHAYATRHRFAHPDPEALLGVIAEHLGAAAEANLRRALHEGAHVNYALRGLRSVALAREAGAPRQFSSRVGLHRNGELTFPVDVVLRTASGERIERRWSGDERATELTHVGPSPIVSVVVDPERRILIEDDWLDNALRDEPAFPLATLERAVYWTQLLLGAIEP